MLNSLSKVYVAGHRGMVGAAIIRQLEQLGVEKIISRTHAELDLCDQVAVRAFMQAQKTGFCGAGSGKSGWDFMLIMSIRPSLFIRI